MFRFSLKQLLALVTLSAVAVVSLKYASDWWVIAVGGLAIIGFFAVLILAVIDRGGRQAFAIGVALVMITYALLVQSNYRDGAASLRPSTMIGMSAVEPTSWLPTSRLLELLYPLITTQVDVPGGNPNVPYAGGPPQATVLSFTIVSPPRTPFMRIGHL